MSSSNKMVKNLLFKKESISKIDKISREDYVLSDKDIDRKKFKIKEILTDSNEINDSELKERIKKI